MVGGRRAAVESANEPDVEAGAAAVVVVALLTLPASPVCPLTPAHRREAAIVEVHTAFVSLRQSNG
jgi:hypothetical protein